MVLWVFFSFFLISAHPVYSVSIYGARPAAPAHIGSILMLLMLGNLGISLGPFHVLKAECSRGLMCPEKGGL